MTPARPVYSEVMEDYAVLAAAIAPLPEDTVVVVSSAGDNVFNALLQGGRRIFGVDIDPLETALCRLKEAAIRELDWQSFARLVGSETCGADARRELLERLPAALIDDACGDPEVLDDVLRYGLAACGQLTAFVAPLREGLTQIVGGDVLEQILTCADREQRSQIFDRHFDVPAVREFLGLALNEQTISDNFIPAYAWGRMAQPEFHRFYHDVLRQLMVTQDPRANHFLHRLWLGRFPSQDAVPPYLANDQYGHLRERLDRISWHTADITSFLRTLPSASVDVVNLSNVLDWCEDEGYTVLWSEVDRVSRSGARVFLRSFLKDRPLPAPLGARWSTDAERSAEMALSDRVGYFARYELWTRAHDRD